MVVFVGRGRACVDWMNWCLRRRSACKKLALRTVSNNECLIVLLSHLVRTESQALVPPSAG